ncbi:ultraviolet-B receptor UVR8 [Cocos nucifera]|uniref:Ultraviolet-B receptor UVR8 n=1 Tax=Cocos nucifera TaxID=13894 RepID=A0A8K0HYN1_COCNU|nr:ultraviolet-B receptor UVR8 [Cocos nucifera]
MASGVWRRAVLGASGAAAAAAASPAAPSFLGSPIPRRRWFSSAPRRFAALWGNGDYGRLGLGSLESRWRPTICPFFQEDLPVSIACGGAHTLFLTGESGLLFARVTLDLLDYSGTPTTWNLESRKMISTTAEPVEILGLPENVAQISAGYHHSCLITEETVQNIEVLYCIVGAESIVSTPTRVDCLDGIHVKAAALGLEHSIAITDEGNVLSWGAGGSGRLGHGLQSRIFGFSKSSSGTDVVKTPESVESSFLKFPITEVSCGWKHTAVISGGNVFTWGWGGASGTFFEDGHSSGGQLGHGDDVDYFEPMVVNIGQNVEALLVSCGFNHTGGIFEYNET